MASYASTVLYIFILTFFLNACAPTPIKTVSKLADKLYEEGKVSSRYFESGNTRLHYVARGNAQNPVVVFLHGTPGDWGIFAHQLNSEVLLHAAYLVSLDRPGWGLSSSHEENLYQSLAKQAEIIVPLLKKLRASSQSQKLVLAGHSLGATLAPYVAMFYPDVVDASIAFSGDLTSQYLEKQWYNEVALWWPIKHLLPQTLIHANNEVLALPGNLDEMAKHWSSLATPLLVFQGGKDFLVDNRNAEFTRNLETRSVVELEYYPEQGHFVHLELHSEVNLRIVDLLESLLYSTKDK